MAGMVHINTAVVASRKMMTKVEYQNKAIVSALYSSLSQGKKVAMTKFLARDLEWWFHGPPDCKHMMRMLTGETSLQNGFKFEPQSIAAIKDYVIAEGWEGKSYWVHVWTLEGSLIVQFREQFNTWLVVRHLRRSFWEGEPHSLTLWRSQSRDLHQQSSLPELVLTI